ncbi:MAG TPA: hypothetical protein VHX11_01370 [Acidobacteriaceae bacterium]|nr:hypothetical protein [Acidobacteriaceae bacterium]
MQAHIARFSILILFLLIVAGAVPASAAGAAQNDTGADSASSPCASFINSNFPKAVLSNGVVQAVVYLPDAQNGYYRASRFDWSGVVPCLSYKGHTYFGIWFNRYDPMINDAIAGPVEEFRSSDGLSSIGYSDAQPGGLFIKPGVGVLRKVDNSPYKFNFTYPLVDRGKWTVHVKRDQVTFTQNLRSPLGISFVYEKTLKLAKNEPVLLVEHRLKNTGGKPIDSEVYDHDFFMIDKTPTGPGMVVHFRFTPQPKTPLGPRAKIDGQDLVYLQPLSSPGPRSRQAQVSSYLTGFSDNPSDYDFTVENQNTGVGVEQTADVPISQLNFWSISTTICPEAYVHLNVAPGETTHWNIRYRFFAK